jgi:hypothetical protein
MLKMPSVFRFPRKEVRHRRGSSKGPFRVESFEPWLKPSTPFFNFSRPLIFFFLELKQHHEKLCEIQRSMTMMYLRMKMTTILTMILSLNLRTKLPSSSFNSLKKISLSTKRIWKFPDCDEPIAVQKRRRLIFNPSAESKYASRSICCSIHTSKPTRKKKQKKCI